MSVERKKIVKFCEDYLKVKDFKDYCVNGLQVEGADKVERIVTGVSLSQKLIQAAIERKAQMVMVHHGLFKNDIGEPPRIKQPEAGRLKLLLSHDINLCGFHLPLDAHSEIGNNASLCKLLGIRKPEPIYVGYVGELAATMALADFVKKVDDKLNTKSYVLAAGQKKVRRIGVISGGASPDFVDAAAAGADTYLCGDMREEVVRKAEEIGVNIINAGHYNTEKAGIINLGNLLAKKFKVKVEFVDVPNEI